MVNSWVHVFMYVYYQMTATNMKISKKYKKFMTMIQIVRKRANYYYYKKSQITISVTNLPFLNPFWNADPILLYAHRVFRWFMGEPLQLPRMDSLVVVPLHVVFPRAIWKILLRDILERQ